MSSFSALLALMWLGPALAQPRGLNFAGFTRPRLKVLWPVAWWHTHHSPFCKAPASEPIVLIPPLALGGALQRGSIAERRGLSSNEVVANFLIYSFTANSARPLGLLWIRIEARWKWLFIDSENTPLFCGFGLWHHIVASSLTSPFFSSWLK